MKHPYKPASGVEIKPSKGRGRGVFAVRRFRAGEIIETAPALTVPKTDVDVLAKTYLGSYLFTTDNGKNLVLGLGISSMFNHEDEANAEFDVFVDCISIRAKKAITIGQEITINYGWRAKEWNLAGVEPVKGKLE